MSSMIHQMDVMLNRTKQRLGKPPAYIELNADWWYKLAGELFPGKHITELTFRGIQVRRLEQ